MTREQLQTTAAAVAAAQEETGRVSALLAKLALLDDAALADLPSLADLPPAVVSRFVSLHDERREAREETVRASGRADRYRLQNEAALRAFSEIEANFSTMTKAQIGARLRAAVEEMNAL